MEAHQMGPPWLARHPSAQMMLLTNELHLNAWWAAYRWKQTDIHTPTLEMYAMYITGMAISGYGVRRPSGINHT